MKNREETTSSMSDQVVLIFKRSWQ